MRAGSRTRTLSTFHHTPIRLVREEVESELGPNAPPFSIDVLPSCASSNSLLLERAQAGAPHRSVLACDEQTAGRGRRGRSWIAVPGGSLTFSLLWRFAPGFTNPSGLSLAVGVSTVRALESLGGSAFTLKWPNDVLHGGRKLAGILIELVPGADRSLGAVIGIGVNVRLPDTFALEGEVEATDLCAAMPEPPSRGVLLAKLLLELESTLDAFGQLGFACVREDWLARQAYRDARVRVTLGPDVLLEGRCLGVDDDGTLLLATERGVERIVAGDVSLRPE